MFAVFWYGGVASRKEDPALSDLICDSSTIPALPKQPREPL